MALTLTGFAGGGRNNVATKPNNSGRVGREKIWELAIREVYQATTVEEPHEQFWPTALVEKRTKKETVRSAPITLRADDHSRVFTGTASAQPPLTKGPLLAARRRERNASNRSR